MALRYFPLRRARPEHFLHAALDAVLGEILLDHAANARVLVLVLDLIAALLDALRRAPLLSQAGKFPAAEGFQREIARGLAAGVEMLVEPALGRHEQAAGAPLVAL